ncbi:MAG TPA: AAA family ATPase [Acidimicrobiales bacterium]|nr:AAA family ATPase [Acidimicrobiales bacterium]
MSDPAGVLERSRQIEAERNGSEPQWELAEKRHVVSITQWEPVDLDPVLKGECVTPKPSVLERSDGVRLLYPGRLNLLMGETESGKTWAALVAVTQELGARNHVIYCDFEDSPESVVERLRALGATVEQITSGLTYINPAGRFDELAQEEMRDAIARKGVPTLAVIDGVTEAMGDVGLDPSSGPDVAAYYASSPRWLARTGAAVVLVDHVTKSRENRGRWAIGSERKLSGLDGAAYGFEMVRPFGRGRTGSVKVTVAKDRCGHIRQFEGIGHGIVVMELKSWPDGGVTATLAVPDSVTDEAFRPTYLMEKLSTAIADSPGLTTRALRAAVKGKNDAKDLALELLVNEGYVDIEFGPNRAKKHVPLKPFRLIEGGGNDADF